MKNQEKEPKEKIKSLRIKVSDRSKQILDAWQSQLKEKYPGIKISDADLVNWCLGKQLEPLSKKDISEIESQFFDAIKQLEWMLAEARAAKAEGQTFSIPIKEIPSESNIPTFPQS